MTSFKQGIAFYRYNFCHQEEKGGKGEEEERKKEKKKIESRKKTRFKKFKVNKCVNWPVKCSQQ